MEKNEYLDLYRQMVLIRRLEDRKVRLADFCIYTSARKLSVLGS